MPQKNNEKLAVFQLTQFAFWVINVISHALNSKILRSNLPLDRRAPSTCLSVRGHFRWSSGNSPLGSTCTRSTPSRTQHHCKFETATFNDKFTEPWGKRHERFHYDEYTICKKHPRENGGDRLPAEHLWMGVHDIQRLFEAAILNKANDFTVKGRHIIPVFVQNCDRRDGRHVLNTAHNIHLKTNKLTWKHCD